MSRLNHCEKLNLQSYFGISPLKFSEDVTVTSIRLQTTSFLRFGLSVPLW
jgi:hypothetical protein